VLGILLRVLGVGALVAGGVVVAVAALVATLLLGPLVFWVAWNVLDFGHAVGLPELGFLGNRPRNGVFVVGWFPKVVITAIVFLVDPSWFQGTAQARWPEPTFRTSSPLRCSPCSRRARTHHAQKRRAKGARGRTSFRGS